MTFGQTLAGLRRARGWSQEMLAHRAGLSQRHISFLETGRSQPGAASSRKLIKAMALKAWEHRMWIASISPDAAQESSWAHEQEFVESFVERMTPWPAQAFKPDGSLIAINRPMRKLLCIAAPNEDLWTVTGGLNGANIYDLVFHPQGLIRWMINPREVIPETLRRLRVEASNEPGIVPVLKRMESYDTAQQFRSPDTIPSRILTERYRVGDKAFGVISVLSHLASPGEISLDLLRVESFVPADDLSADFLSGV